MQCRNIIEPFDAVPNAQWLFYAHWLQKIMGMLWGPLLMMTDSKVNLMMALVQPYSSVNPHLIRGRVCFLVLYLLPRVSMISPSIVQCNFPPSYPVHKQSPPFNCIGGRHQHSPTDGMLSSPLQTCVSPTLASKGPILDATPGENKTNEAKWLISDN